jgi:aerobic carbon-monoxide dehydrogenase small subunit
MSKGEGATSSERWPAIRFNVNGETRIVKAPPMKRLLDVLREDLHLTGTKEGCGEGECGSCSVRMNGELVNSCLVPVLQAEGADIQTVEGLALDGELHPLQKAFLQHGGAQCGICTPGMLMAAAQLLEQNPHPGIVQIREALAGNLCRCTGFIRIFESVAAAVAPENARLATESTSGQSRDAREEAPHAR